MARGDPRWPEIRRSPTCRAATRATASRRSAARSGSRRARSSAARRARPLRREHTRLHEVTRDCTRLGRLAAAARVHAQRVARQPRCEADAGRRHILLPPNPDPSPAASPDPDSNPDSSPDSPPSPDASPAPPRPRGHGPRRVRDAPLAHMPRPPQSTPFPSSSTGRRSRAPSSTRARARSTRRWSRSPSRAASSPSQSSRRACRRPAGRGAASRRR